MKLQQYDSRLMRPLVQYSGITWFRKLAILKPILLLSGKHLLYQLLQIEPVSVRTVSGI